MRWVALTEKDTANKVLEKRLWDAADKLRANCDLTCLKCDGPPAGNANFAWVQDIIHHLAATGSDRNDPAHAQ